MLQVGEVVISADVEDIVSQIQEETGLLRDIRELENDLMVTCPIHKGGMEHTPSLGINKESGVTHCFTCGYKGDIITLVSDCYSISYSQAYRKLVGHFVYSGRRTLDIDISRGNSQLHTYIDKHKVYRGIQDNHKAMAYLADRGVNINKISLFSIGYDAYNNTIDLYTRDLKGNYTVCKSRRLDKKVFLNSQGANKADYLFGAYELIQSAWQPEHPLWICESEIDALTIWGRGEYAVAIMGSHISNKQLDILKQLGVRRLVDGLDRDDAGREGWSNIKKFTRGISTYDTIFPTQAKDINDLSDDEFTRIKIR